MKIVAFLQLYNEYAKGNLVRCLDNCKKWAKDIFIYDDCSNDGSQEIYLRYTEPKNIILSQERRFRNEIFNKQCLLELTLASNPDWIVWQDGDAILDHQLTLNLESILGSVQNEGCEGMKVHYLNLWRHPAYYRLDNKFNNLWTLSFWKNTGQLRYEPTEGLHHPQYPLGIDLCKIAKRDHQIIHFGFSSEEQIVRKYLTYKSVGQTGYALDRLVDEQTSFVIEKAKKEWYPEENIPIDFDTASAPQPITYNEYREFNSWEEFLKVKK